MRLLKHQCLVASLPLLLALPALGQLQRPGTPQPPPPARIAGPAPVVPSRGSALTRAQGQAAQQGQAAPQGQAARPSPTTPTGRPGQREDPRSVLDRQTFFQQQAMRGMAGSSVVSPAVSPTVSSGFSPAFNPALSSNFAPSYSPSAYPFPGSYPYGGAYAGYGQTGTSGQGQQGGNGQAGQTGAGGYGGMQGGQGQPSPGAGGQGSYGGQEQGAGGARIVSTRAGRPTSDLDGGGPFPVPFFRMDHVVRKLDLSREQFDRLTTLTANLQARFRPELSKASILPEREGQSRRDEALREYGEEWLKGAQEILSEKQLALYRELGPQSQLP